MTWNSFRVVQPRQGECPATPEVLDALRAEMRVIPDGSIVDKLGYKDWARKFLSGEDRSAQSAKRLYDKIPWEEDESILNRLAWDYDIQEVNIAARYSKRLNDALPGRNG